MKENSIQEMFKKLKDNLGKNVTCIYWQEGILKIDILKLAVVENYRYIATGNIEELDTEIIQFISYDECIISIEDMNGNILYQNNTFEEKFQRINSEEELIKIEKLIFGENYISETEKNSEDYLIKAGLEQISKDLSEKWIDFVNKKYRINHLKIIKATISMLEKINQGMSYYAAEIQVYREEFNLGGFETSEVDMAISMFGKKNAEYREYSRNNVSRKSMQNPTKSPRKQALIRKLKKQEQIKKKGSI